MPDTSFHLNSYRCWYINNCLMDVFSGISRWFSEVYFKEFKTVVLGGYCRAIREIQNSLKDGQDADKPVLPAIAIDPFGDIATDNKFAQLWRLTDIGENLQDLYMHPQYQDDYFGFSVIANRFTGNFQVIIFVQSPYEYLDHYLQSIMFFHGGFNRRVRPGLIRTNVLIPDEVITTAYQDAPYDWTNSGITREFNKVINRDHFVFPMEIGPQVWLTSISNASAVYGEDGLSTYKLQLTCEYDVDLPTHIIVRNNDLIEHLNIKLQTSDPLYIPGNIPLHTTNEEQIVFDDKHLKGMPADSLGRSPYFKRLKAQEYHKYMFTSDLIMKICNRTRLRHYATLQYNFDQDIKATDGHKIDISGAKLKVGHYDQIIIGDRKGVLDYGTPYIVDTEDTGMIISVNIDVEKGSIWDIILYQFEEQT